MNFSDVFLIVCFFLAIQVINMSENEVKCPFCSDVLNEYPKGSAILFVCPKCGFKLLTTKELFSRYFWRKVQRDDPQNSGSLRPIESQAKVH